MIFNIQRCSIHDGSGLRTLVFFKGCPLNCPWCANPESKSYQSDIMELSTRCIRCGSCEKICPESAITSVSGEFRINRELCRHCFQCAEHCYAESKRVVGKEYSVDELFVEIKKDYSFYSLYGGGVTFSGGEPLTHPEFLTEIAKKCKKNGIDVAIETCGYGVYDEFKTVLPYINQIFFDIKHIDTDVHKFLTGKENKLILNNLKWIADFGIPITVRTPVIPGYTNSFENIVGIAKFISVLPNIKEYELLPYHNLGESKYRHLGKVYPIKGTVIPQNSEMRMLVKHANQILRDYYKECFFIKDNRKEIVL